MKEDDYLLLLYKQLDARLEPDEATSLQQWLGESAENQHLADDVRKIWVASGDYQPSFSINPDADFSKIQARIQKEEFAPSAKRVALGSTLMRIAAALAFVLVAVWGYRSFNTVAAPLQTAYANEGPHRLVELSDGSKVWLRQGSSLEFPASFDAGSRVVHVHGEAYFEVAHDASRPFRVAIDGGQWVEVLGTQFNIQATETDQTSVLVRSGKVRFTPEAGGEGVYLEAGKKAVYDKKAQKITLSEPGSFNELAWQAGGLEFIHTPLAQVVKDLENWYKVSVVLDNPALANCPYTAPLTRQSIAQVLNVLAETYQMQLQKTGASSYRLSGGTCQ